MTMEIRNGAAHDAEAVLAEGLPLLSYGKDKRLMEFYNCRNRPDISYEGEEDPVAMERVNRMPKVLSCH